MITNQDIEEMFGIDAGEISSGCTDIIGYCNYEEKSLPDWFVPDFINLPRHVDKPDEDWITVRVDGLGNRYGPSVRAGTVFSWVIENLENSWSSLDYRNFYFENRKDAFRFKMVWG